MTFRTSLVIAAFTFTAAACGGDDGPSSPSGGGNDGTIAATLTITSAGISPRTVTVPIGSRVTIVNNDTQTHNMNSDPHPEHTNCVAMNLGVLSVGQSRTSQNLTTARACGIHDHDRPDTASLQATITVQ